MKIHFIVVVLAATVLPSCSDITDSKVCTDIFRMISVRVLTADEEPVVLDELTITDKKLKKEYDLCQDGGLPGRPQTGSYVVMHDHYAGKINGKRDLILSGSNETYSLQEEITVEDDGCHIYKVAGPDTITVE